ncbi:hypothetical protein MESS2_800011 [Mesorhizobium metallidurans STM 2683]|uniref:Uncharacterized protein n=1 Tax=Mesorhizobium metallidurans STM 2683 TaxID=1297569 RepID=M5EYC0_9HYPH|nr:hypothetical protein [Mesorhizobium metallidurans]CCV09013.1 hypothetical protein MESS2_800011 [Mesorhizobium metallidurans STM 2683]
MEAVEQVGKRNVHAVHGVGAGMPEIADDGKTTSDDKVYRLNLMVIGTLDDDFVKATLERPAEQDRPALDDLFK